MWDEEYAEYYWVVLCKNRQYHLKQSQAAGHPILLGGGCFDFRVNVSSSILERNRWESTKS